MLWSTEESRERSPSTVSGSDSKAFSNVGRLFGEEVKVQEDLWSPRG